MRGCLGLMFGILLLGTACDNPAPRPAPIQPTPFQPTPLGTATLTSPSVLPATASSRPGNAPTVFTTLKSGPDQATLHALAVPPSTPALEPSPTRSPMP